MNTEAAEVPGLFRAWVFDEELGPPRLVWALESDCPVCERGFISVYEGEGQPDRGDILLVKLWPCLDGVKDYPEKCS